MWLNVYEQHLLHELDFEVERNNEFVWARDLIANVELPAGLVIENPVDRTVFGVAGRPKQGKSMVLLWLARQLAESGRKVLFVSLEMTQLQCMNRLLAQVAGIDSNLIATMQRSAYAVPIPVCGIDLKMTLQ